ncbi:hypothetical protein [Bacillus altitudinis]|uniref:hypothetical protein n=1 Tax=Bacillus altitudinis TaxID=293387 RepID=UPI003D1E0CAA
MAKYTTQIRTIIESTNSEDTRHLLQGGGISPTARKKIFDFDYPIFDEDYRPILEDKIITHYYFNEIGLETLAQFKWFLKARLKDIMPYYNQLYKSELIKFDPMINVKFNEKSLRNIKGLSDTNTESIDDQSTNSNYDNTDRSAEDFTGKNVGGKSDTPQTALAGIEDTLDVYMSEAEISKDNNKTDRETNAVGKAEGNTHAESVGKAKTEVKNEDDYIKDLLGNNGSKNFSELLLDFRKTFINVDKMIIDELKDLFMSVY